MRGRILEWQKSNKGRMAKSKWNTLERQKMKRMLDGTIAFSTDVDESNPGTVYELSSLSSAYGLPNWTRLLDEGVIIECDGSIDSIIAKGAIKRWFDALPDDFEGNIDKDHNRSIDLGTFTKEQLKLVELGDGRYGVDVDVKLDEELNATQDLIKMNNRKAISSEFRAINGYAVQASSVLGDQLDRPDYQIPVITEVALTGYGVVETPLNANSYNEHILERAFSAKPIVEGTDMTEEELKAKAAAEAAEAAKNAEETKAEEKAEEAPAEDEPGRGGEGADAEPETKDESEQKDASDVVTENIDECPDKEEGDAEDKDAAAVTLKDLQAAIETLKADNEAKDAKIKELESKLSETKVVQNDFQSKLAKMLNFATSTEPTMEESKEATPAKKEEEGDAVMKAYASAFKDLN